jgi:hypothetical protein
MPSSVSSCVVRVPTFVALYFSQFRQSKVQNLHLTFVRHHQVRWFQVTMDNPRRVSSGQGVRGLDGNLQGLIQFHPLPGYPLIQRLAVGVLHHDKVNILFLPDVVNRDDVRMVQGRGGTSFLNESASAFRVSHLVCGQDLNGHESFEADIPRLVDHSHAATAEN